MNIRFLQQKVITWQKKLFRLDTDHFILYTVHRTNTKTYLLDISTHTVRVFYIELLID